MSEKDRLNQRKVLDMALKESFRKMLDLKKKLGLPVVTSDSQGNPIVISAEEAERIVNHT